MITAVRTTRFIVGLSLMLVPFFASAQESGSGAVSPEPERTLQERLSILAESGTGPETLIISASTKTSWTSEVKRYAERSGELRSRCNEEIRKANRDTIASKAAQCLRSDLLLEISHRRKQQEILTTLPGVTVPATNQIDAFLDAAVAVVDGVDAGVFATIDVLREAKKNLHQNYRRPMLEAITLARVSVLGTVIHSLALTAQNVVEQIPETDLMQIVECLEEATLRHTTAASATTLEDAVAGFRSTLSAVTTCRNLVGALSEA